MVLVGSMAYFESKCQEAQDSRAGLVAEVYEVRDLGLVGGERCWEGLLGFSLLGEFAEVECSVICCWLIKLPVTVQVE